MPPDLNSVPLSPRSAQSQSTSTSTSTSQPTHPDSRRASAAPSRRASQIHAMNPPPLPLASPGNALPTGGNGIPFPPLSPAETNASGSGLPMRHPRPMTPAEMHLELEKEQEAIVNRLTRELSALRAHSSSVASTTSISSSATSNAYHDALPSADPAHPVPTRTRHRSSSSLSNTHRAPSLSNIADLATASTPSAAARTPSISAGGAGPNILPTTPRYEEVLLHRSEMEDVRRENEKLRRRVRELEAMVRGRRRESAVSTASASVSARGSVSAASASDRERSVSVRRGRGGEGVVGTGEERRHG